MWPYTILHPLCLYIPLNTFHTYRIVEHSDKLMCTDSANKTIEEDCGRTFTGGMGHIFGLHKERDAPRHILTEIACE